MPNPEQVAPPSRSLKILIVDDHEIFRRYLSETLVSQFPFLSIEQAEDGRQALEKTGSFVPELVFMDIHLPDASGLDLTEKIHAEHPRTAIVVLSHHDLPEYRARAYENGALDYISKDSLNPGQINKLIRQALLRGP